MLVENTGDIKVDGNIVMILYGRGGVGKTTFAATAPKPLLIDFENGSKFLGERGLHCDVVRMSQWFTRDDMVQLKNLFPKYDTIVLDPIGEAMEKLIASPTLDGKKFRQADGSLSMAGWGEAKRKMKELVKWLRDAGKNVIIVAHVAEGKDGEQTTYRIQIATRLSDELPTMVDIISYMGIRKNAGGEKQVVLYTPAQGGNYDSKDRTGRLPEIVPVSELHGWDDFKAAMAAKSCPAPESNAAKNAAPAETEVHNVTSPESTPVIEQNGNVIAQAAQPSDEYISLEQLVYTYRMELKGKPYKLATECLNDPKASVDDLAAMYKRCVDYLARCGIKVV